MRSLWIGTWLACVALALATGCNRNKGDDASADPQAASAEAQAGLVEERDDGKLEWIVQADGRVRVSVTAKEGAPPVVSGSLMLDGQSFPLTAEGTTLTATVPALTGELTTIAYSLKVGEATWDGALHVPPGGTNDLLAVPTVTVPEGTKGPHGGAVDVVGDQRVELVVDEKSGEVRVYLLDEKLQPIPVGDATAVAGFAQ
jgi:hypothetical protein